MDTNRINDNMRLDVGCGVNPTGDVNCDLYMAKSPHFDSRFTIKPKNIPNFVRCDCHCLPFKDKAFTECFCRHVLEHKGIRPIKVLKELIRVTHGSIQIIVPHRCVEHHNNPIHARRFNMQTLEALLRLVGLSPSLNVISWKNIPNSYIPLLRFPREIIAEASTYGMTPFG